MKRETIQSHVVLHPVPELCEVGIQDDGKLHIQVCVDGRRYNKQHSFGTSGNTIGVVSIYKVDQRRLDARYSEVFTECVHSDQGIDAYPTLSALLEHLEPDMWSEYYNIIMSGQMKMLRCSNFEIRMKNMPGYMGAIEVHYSENKKDFNYRDNLKH